MIYFRAGQLERAVEELKSAQKFLPEDPQVQLNYGVALLEKKDYAEAERQAKIGEAEREFQQSIKLGGDPAGRAHYYLGGIYWSRRDYKKAADELENYLKISPKAPDAEQ